MSDRRLFLRSLAAATVVATGLATGGAQARVPSDPLAATWTYGAVNLPAAWDVTTGSEAVVIAVVDTGVDGSHPDLAGAVDSGFDFVDEDQDASDENGHGTAVAGIAAGRADNGIGAAGVCWRCRIMPLRVIGPDGFARWAWIARAIDYAVEHGAAVVNASIYGETEDPAVRYAIQRARAAGVLVVAAAGNEGRTLPEYPAAFPEVISVGATTEQNTLASYSSRGDWVKLAAPACVPTSQLGGGFGPGCGTSGATPVVAGVIGLLRAQASFATAAELENALLRTARPVPGTQFGLVDAAAAIVAVGQPSPHIAPAIFGLADVGQTLRAYSGLWIGAGLGIEYSWQRCRGARCEPVGQGRVYAVRRQDRGYRLRVLLTAPGLDAPASVSTAVVPEAPRNTARPFISGRAVVGTTLVGHPGSWAGKGVAFEYRWLRCRSACVRGAVVSRTGSYRLRKADRGRWLQLIVTATNNAGKATASSRPTATIR
jgi:subtilase family protein